MADRLVEHDARPARTKYYIHLAGRGWYRPEVKQRLAHRLIDGVAPSIRCDETVIALASAIAVAAGLLPITLASHNRDVYTYQRPDVAIDFAVGPQDFHDLPRRRNACRNLSHAFIFGASVGVNVLQQLHLGIEGGCGKWIAIGIESPVSADRRIGDVPRVAAFDCAHRVGGSHERRL